MSIEVQDLQGRNITLNKKPVGQEVFMSFEGVKDFIKTMDEWVSQDDKKSRAYRAAQNNIDSPSSSFNGTNDGNEMRAVANGTDRKFLDDAKLNDFISTSKSLFEEISLGGSFDKDRMIATDLPIGVFSFDLASQGLYRPMEYFSPDLNRIIDPNLVISTRVGDTDEYVFTYEEDGQVYILVQQQEGTNDGKPIFRTRTKKVNLIRGGRKSINEDSDQDAKYVDLFVPIGGLSYATTDQLIYRALPAILVAYNMQIAGIKCSINGVYQGSSSYDRLRDNSNSFYITYGVKTYEENLDFNQICLELGDPRIFRGRDFSYISATFNKLFQKDIGSGLGSALSTISLEEQFLRYKNWLVAEAKKGEKKLFNRNKNLMIQVGRTYSDSVNDVDKLKKDAIEEFYRTMDAIDVEFNGVKEATRRIFERDLARQKTLQNIKLRLLGSVVTKASNFSYSKSEFSDTEQDIRYKFGLAKKRQQDILDIEKQFKP